MFLSRHYHRVALLLMVITLKYCFGQITEDSDIGSPTVDADEDAVGDAADDVTTESLGIDPSNTEADDDVEAEETSKAAAGDGNAVNDLVDEDTTDSDARDTSFEETGNNVIGEGSQEDSGAGKAVRVKTCKQASASMSKFTGSAFIPVNGTDDSMGSMSIGYAGCKSGVPISLHFDCLQMQTRHELLMYIKSALCGSALNTGSGIELKLEGHEARSCESIQDSCITDYHLLDNKIAVLQHPDQPTLLVQEAFEGRQMVAVCQSFNGIPKADYSYGNIITIH